MGVAASAWNSQGHENLFCEPADVLNDTVMDWRNIPVCVVPKYSNDRPLEPWLNACSAAKINGCRLILDVCDYPFGKDAIFVENFYSTTLQIADAVVVNSERMAEALKPHFRKQITLIEDAVLDPMASPAFSPSGKLKLLWFGHPSNLRFLKPWIRTLLESGPRPYRLVIVTQDGYGVREDASHIQAQFGPDIEVRFVEWSLESTRRELAECDCAVLPGNPLDSVKAGISANRIAEILNAGRFPIASPFHSYLPFADSAWLGNNLLDGIGWAQAHPEEVIDRIRRGQKLVSERFVCQKIGQQWCELLENVAAQKGTLQRMTQFLRNILR